MHSTAMSTFFTGIKENNMKRVRFETVPVGGKCKTEWDENIMKTEEVRIKTDSPVNYRNAVNLDTGKLLPVDPAQWVWIEET